MPRLQSAIQQVRLRGLPGVHDLLRSNLWASTDCLRLRTDLRERVCDGMCGSDPVRVERGDLSTLNVWRRSQPQAELSGDFLADCTHGLRHFYLGYWNGELAHIVWLAGAGDATTVSSWRAQVGEVELRNALTLQRFRRKGIYRRVVRCALADLSARGIRTAYAHVEEHNHASLETLYGLGFRATHRISLLRVLGMDRVRETPLGHR
jgi:ribosomal protein S18 acetylase RimI-like enzyme